MALHNPRRRSISSAAILGNLDMPATDNPGEVKGTDITKHQIDSASSFLTALGWGKSETARPVKRETVALLIAWYGALRYKAGFLRIGSCEDPGPLTDTTTPPLLATSTPPCEEFEIIDLTVRSLL